MPPHPEAEDLGDAFSGAQAAAHLAALSGLAPRLPGSGNDLAARVYLRREFELVGARVSEWEDGDQRHIVAELPGQASDRVVLVAPYPLLTSTRWIDDAGAALLLELARVFARQPRDYRLQFVLAETRPGRRPAGADGSELRDDDPDRWRAVGSQSSARFRASEAGRSLLRASDAQGYANPPRAIVTFEVRARPGLRIARDLRSHPVFRNLFWETAAAQGFEATFPPAGDWTSPPGLHTGFRERSIDAMLVLVDERAARPDLPIEGAVSPEDAVSARSLAAVGSVSVDALDQLMHRFAKIDAFGPPPDPRGATSSSESP